MAIEKWRIKLVYIHPFIQLFTLPTVSCRIQNHYDRIQLCNDLKIINPHELRLMCFNFTFNVQVRYFRSKIGAIKWRVIFLKCIRVIYFIHFQGKQAMRIPKMISISLFDQPVRNRLMFKIEVGFIQSLPYSRYLFWYVTGIKLKRETSTFIS